MGGDRGNNISWIQRDVPFPPNLKWSNSLIKSTSLMSRMERVLEGEEEHLESFRHEFFVWESLPSLPHLLVLLALFPEFRIYQCIP